MNRLERLLLAVVCLAIAACAGTATTRYMTKAEMPESAPAPDKAAIYFIQRSGHAKFDHFQIWDGNNFVGLSQANSYFVYQCDPGNHLFLGVAENKLAVKAQLAAGKAYYILLEPVNGWARNRLEMVPVSRGSQFWDKVDGMKRELEFIVPVKEETSRWEGVQKAKANMLVNYFTTDPASEKYMTQMRLEDGR